MASLLIQVFLISFFLNLLWEIFHSRLYITCLKSPLRKFIPLIIGASLKDGFWISLFFLISVYIFGNIYILENQFQLLFFVFLALMFSFFDEKISLKMKRWEYSKQMPIIFGIGITPLLELAITGVLTFILLF